MKGVHTCGDKKAQMKIILPLPHTLLLNYRRIGKTYCIHTKNDS